MSIIGKTETLFQVKLRVYTSALGGERIDGFRSVEKDLQVIGICRMYLALIDCAGLG